MTFSACAWRAAAAALTIAVATVGQVRAGDDDPVKQFVREQLNGKTLGAPERVERIDNGAVESVITTTVRFHGFTETKSGFFFDVETAIRQTLYELDDNGARKEPGQIKDRGFTLRYRVGRRLSTGQYVGVAWSIDEKGGIAEDDDYPFSPYTILIRAEEGTVTMVSSSALYQDLYAKDGRWRPGIQEDTSVFSVENGKIRRAVKVKGYDVDPKTLEKTLSDDLPERVETELDAEPKK